MFEKEREQGFFLSLIQWENIERWICMWEKERLYENPDLKLHDGVPRVKFSFCGGGYGITFIKRGERYIVGCSTHGFRFETYLVPEEVDERLPQERYRDYTDFSSYYKEGFRPIPTEWKAFDIWQNQYAESVSEEEILFYFVNTGIVLRVLICKVTEKFVDITDYSCI